MKSASLSQPGALVPHPRRLAAALISACAGLVGLATPMTSHAIEEPEYTVVRQLEGVEIRDYPPFTVAETVVTGSESDAGNLAFPILAGYIFGKNKGERKLAMTAPQLA